MTATSELQRGLLNELEWDPSAHAFKIPSVSLCNETDIASAANHALK